MKVLIADDHSIVRSGLGHLLAEMDGQVAIDAATTFDRARDLVENGGSFDLVVLDLRMPGVKGLDDVEALVRRVAPVPVVVFSMVDSPEEMRAVLARGARAFIPKSTDDVVIVNILRLVLAGGSYVPPVLGLGPPPVDGAEPAARSAVPPPLAGLTPRQGDVLELLAEGLSNQEIGERLGLNLSTVKTHVTGILKTLGVASRTQAVLLYKQMADNRP